MDIPFSPEVEKMTDKAAELFHEKKFKEFPDAARAVIAASRIEEWRVKKLLSQICKCGNKRAQAVKKAKAGRLLFLRNNFGNG